MNDLARDHALLIDAVRAAGAIALDFFRGEVKHWQKAPGDPVSEADHAVDAFLREQLTRERPDYAWLSEETDDDRKRLHCRDVWVVDPIDGTRAFIEKREEFTVCAALVRDQRPVAGVVYNPATEEFFEALEGGGARLNGEPMRAGDKDSFENAKMLAGRLMFERAGWEAPPAGMTFHSINSIAYRMCLAACGKFDGCVSLAAKSDWDIAAADVIVREAGGRAGDSHGSDFIYNRTLTRHLSVIAAGAPMHARLIDFLKTVKRPAGAKW